MRRRSSIDGVATGLHSRGAMRAVTGAAVTGLVLAGVVSTAYAQSWLQAPLCSPSQVGMPCNSNQYDLCLPTLCFHIADAGGAGVPTSCTECTACVQADCRAVGCPNGGVCTYEGTPQTPCGGFGYGPPSNVDQTVIANPVYRCTFGNDGGAPAAPLTPTCPDLTGWTDLCGPQPGGGSSPGDGGAPSGNSSVDAGAGDPASGSSSGAGWSMPAGGAAAGGSSGAGATAGSRAAGVEAGTPAPSEEVVFGPRACTIGPEVRTRESRGAWPVALALGVLLMRRKATSPR
jgi:hypothetical protein